MPVTSDAHQAFNGGGFDGVLARFSGDLSTLFYATYLGGGGEERTGDIAVNQNGQVGIVGLSSSSNFPAVNSSDFSVQGQWGILYVQVDPE